MEGGAVSDLSSRNSLQSDSLRTEPSLVSSSLIDGLERSHHSLRVFEERWRLLERASLAGFSCWRGVVVGLLAVALHRGQLEGAESLRLDREGHSWLSHDSLAVWRHVEFGHVRVELTIVPFLADLLRGFVEVGSLVTDDVAVAEGVTSLLRPLCHHSRKLRLDITEFLGVGWVNEALDPLLVGLANHHRLGLGAGLLLGAAHLKATLLRGGAVQLDVPDLGAVLADGIFVGGRGDESLGFNLGLCKFLLKLDLLVPGLRLLRHARLLQLGGLGAHVRLEMTVVLAELLALIEVELDFLVEIVELIGALG